MHLKSVPRECGDEKGMKREKIKRKKDTKGRGTLVSSTLTKDKNMISDNSKNVNTTDTDYFKKIEKDKRIIAYRSDFTRLCGGDGETGIVLSQIYYWARVSLKKTGAPRFWKTRREWESETGLSMRKIDAARRNLRKIGVISEERRDFPAKTWVFLRGDVLCALLFSQTTQSPPSNPKEQHHTKREKKTESPEINPSIVPLPDKVDRQLFLAFIDYRKNEIKKPMGSFAIKLFIQRLEELVQDGKDPNESIRESILNGWTGIFPPRDKKKDSGSGIQREPHRMKTFDEIRAERNRQSLEETLRRLDERESKSENTPQNPTITI